MSANTPSLVEQEALDWLQEYRASRDSSLDALRLEVFAKQDPNPLPQEDAEVTLKVLTHFLHADGERGQTSPNLWPFQ